jgi:hypothetical protein
MSKKSQVLYFLHINPSIFLFKYTPQEFYKNTLKLFQNYVLAPVNFHLGP